jgi:non-specific protein-tyrosine kinase
MRQPRSPVSEAFRSLRTNLEFSSIQKPIHSILVTSPGPSEGKTTVAVNLAAIFSQIKKRVILLDADLRRPHVHHLLGLSNREGLSSLFLNTDHASNIGRSREDLPNLVAITSGSLPPNPAELLGSEKMSRILQEMTRNVDLVVIDTPPSLVADALILAAKVDAVLFVIKPGFTRVETARASVKSFNRIGARVVGVVMNRIPRNRSHYYGGYTYYSPHNDSQGYFSGNGSKPSEKSSEGTADKHAVHTAARSAVASQPVAVDPPASNDTLNRMFEQLKSMRPETKKNDGEK